MSQATSLQFERPPVRSVRLAFYLRPTERVTAAQTGGLFDLWRADYPEVSQTPPRAAITEPTRDIGFIGQDDYWPLAFTEMENPLTGKSLFFQEDRFGVIWNFDPDLGDAPEYPGFEELCRELLDRFDRFCSHIRDSGGSLLEVEAAECFYTNEMPDVAIDRYAYGILTKWSDSEYQSDPALRDGVMFSRHYHLGEGPERPVWVAASASEPDTGMVLRITTRVEAEEALDPDRAIRSAHENLISTFLNWTSEEMRRSWGERSA